MDFKKLTSIERDVLREIGNIGAGNAATSMSKLINKKVDMQVPLVNIIAFDEVMELIGGPDELIVAILFRIQGEAPGNVYFILTVEEAESLIAEMVSDQITLFSDEGKPNEIAISALQEAGNILAGSYLSALSDFTKINMQQSIPYFSMDMAGAILSAGLIELSQVSDFAIVIDTKINARERKNAITGQIFLMPDPVSIPKIFQALGIHNYE